MLGRIKNSWKILLICLVVTDISYAYLQHASMPFDGDLIPIIYPSDHYARVLENPFGEAVLFQDEYYAAPNRFFVHWAMYHTFRQLPRLLQQFMSPIESIYAAAGISKILIQLALLGLLTLYSNPGKSTNWQNWLIGCFLIMPLFQNSGYYFDSMGIIDQSITYTFFYALPLSFVLLYAYPFVFQKSWRWNWPKVFIWLLLGIILPLSGALVPGIILVGTLTFLLKSFLGFTRRHLSLRPENLIRWMRKSWYRPEIFLGTIVVSMSIYSLYIGRNNIEGLSASLSVWERYRVMPEGLIQLLFQKPGFLMLFGVIAINALLIRKLEERQVFFNMLKWVGIFGLLYLLLLPLGGYRDYRPLIVRRDTFMPVLFGLIVVYGYSTSLLLRSLRGKSFWFFGGMIMGVLSIFTLADISGLDKNKCEKECLEILAGSNENITRLPADCTVMNWTIRRNPQKSVNIAEMIHYWNITNSVRLYYQE